MQTLFESTIAILDSFAELLRKLAASDGFWGLIKTAIIFMLIYIIVRAVLRFGGKIVSVVLIAGLILWLVVSGFSMESLSNWAVNLMGMFPA